MLGEGVNGAGRVFRICAVLAAAAATTTNLTWLEVLAAAGILLAAILIAGGIVIYGRGKFAGKGRQQKPDPNDAQAGQSAPQSDGDFIRSWLAISLVIALIFFCAFAFTLSDSTLQSTLIGGLIASSGSAVAFYFSSKASDKARQDIVNAQSAGTELVPSLIGTTKTDALQMLGHTSFGLIEDPKNRSAADSSVIKAQNPLANTNAPRGSSIVVSF
jgi:uncharacterized membrane protein